MAQTYTIVGPDGSLRNVTADEFQAAIDTELATHNDGIVPKTDEERNEIIARIRQEP